MDAVIFPDEPNTSYHFIDWAEYGDRLFKLSKIILKKEKTIPERIISIASGGLTLAAGLKDYLGIEKLSTIQVSFYSDIGKRKNKPEIIQDLSVDITGEKVLIFDDINDTGSTLALALEYVKSRGASNAITSAIYQKPHTRTPADYFQQETDCWIIFPDEIRESITSLQNRWQGDYSTEEIDNRLQKIGFSRNHIDLILHSKL